MIEIGTLLQDRYLIEKKIGAGGMGAVYLAVDKRFDNYVAIKETFYIDQEFGEAFEREARLLNASQHSVLPHVSDYFTENNGYFLVMQFIEGEDLSDILKREGAFPVGEVLRWTDSLLDALEYLHSQDPPIIHRDIKPHNLKLTPRGDIMLLDFGLAKLNYADTAGEISVFGYSRTYSPLEQIQGTGTDPRSDIFALGATVYHLLTGRPPVDALTRAAAIVGGKPDPIRSADEVVPAISPAIASVLHSALTLNPENRFISAKAMREALAHARHDEPKPEIVEARFVPPAALPIAQNVEAAGAANFPALAAFAARAEENSPDSETLAGAEIISVLPGPDFRKAHPSTVSAFSTETPTRVSIRVEKNAKPSLWAGLAVALIFAGVVAALFFAGRGSSSDQTIQTPVVEAAPEGKSNRKVSEKLSPNPESVAESKTRTAADQKTAETGRGESSENAAETAENPNEAPESPAETERSAPARRKPQTSNDETNSDDVDEETTDDPEIEKDTPKRETDRPTNKEGRRRRAERPIPDEMSEEEFEKLQQELKQRRRERRNRPQELPEN
jgi:serine/threonine protein kinase